MRPGPTPLSPKIVGDTFGPHAERRKIVTNLHSLLQFLVWKYEISRNSVPRVASEGARVEKTANADSSVIFNTSTLICSIWSQVIMVLLLHHTYPFGYPGFVFDASGKYPICGP